MSYKSFYTFLSDVKIGVIIAFILRGVIKSMSTQVGMTLFDTVLEIQRRIVIYKIT